MQALNNAYDSLFRKNFLKGVPRASTNGILMLFVLSPSFPHSALVFFGVHTLRCQFSFACVLLPLLHSLMLGLTHNLTFYGPFYLSKGSVAARYPLSFSVPVFIAVGVSFFSLQACTMASLANTSSTFPSLVVGTIPKASISMNTSCEPFHLACVNLSLCGCFGILSFIR